MAWCGARQGLLMALFLVLVFSLGVHGCPPGKKRRISTESEGSPADRGETSGSTSTTTTTIAPQAGGVTVPALSSSEERPTSTAIVPYPLPPLLLPRPGRVLQRAIARTGPVLTPRAARLENSGSPSVRVTGTRPPFLPRASVEQSRRPVVFEIFDDEDEDITPEPWHVYCSGIADIQRLRRMSAIDRESELARRWRESSMRLALVSVGWREERELSQVDLVVREEQGRGVDYPRLRANVSPSRGGTVKPEEGITGSSPPSQGLGDEIVTSIASGEAAPVTPSLRASTNVQASPAPEIPTESPSAPSLLSTGLVSTTTTTPSVPIEHGENRAAVASPSPSSPSRTPSPSLATSPPPVFVTVPLYSLSTGNDETQVSSPPTAPFREPFRRRGASDDDLPPPTPVILRSLVWEPVSAPSPLAEVRLEVDSSSTVVPPASLEASSTTTTTSFPSSRRASEPPATEIRRSGRLQRLSELAVSESRRDSGQPSSSLAVEREWTPNWSPIARLAADIPVSPIRVETGLVSDSPLLVPPLTRVSPDVPTSPPPLASSSLPPPPPTGRVVPPLRIPSEGIRREDPQIRRTHRRLMTEYINTPMVRLSGHGPGEEPGSDPDDTDGFFLSALSCLEDYRPRPSSRGGVERSGCPGDIPRSMRQMDLDDPPQRSWETVPRGAVSEWFPRMPHTLSDESCKACRAEALSLIETQVRGEEAERAYAAQNSRDFVSARGLLPLLNWEDNRLRCQFPVANHSCGCGDPTSFPVILFTPQSRSTPLMNIRDYGVQLRLFFHLRVPGTPMSWSARTQFSGVFPLFGLLRRYWGRAIWIRGRVQFTGFPARSNRAPFVTHRLSLAVHSRHPNVLRHLPLDVSAYAVYGPRRDVYIQGASLQWDNSLPSRSTLNLVLPTEVHYSTMSRAYQARVIPYSFRPASRGPSRSRRPPSLAPSISSMAGSVRPSSPEGEAEEEEEEGDELLASRRCSNASSEPSPQGRQEL